MSKTLAKKTLSLILVIVGSITLTLGSGFLVSEDSSTGKAEVTAGESDGSGMEDSANTVEPRPLSEEVELDTSAVTPFYGVRQAGVDTSVNLFQTFLGYNLDESDKDLAQAALVVLTDDAARLTQGEPALGDMEPEVAQEPANLTITVGLGENFYNIVGKEKPAQLKKLPEFSTDKLRPEWGQTDFIIQVSSNDPLTLSHTVRMLNKSLANIATVQWRQDGYLPVADAVEGSESKRNLMGQVDGTVNPKPNTKEFDDMVWVASDNELENNGTVLVLRRIKLLMDEWDLLDQVGQEDSIGRQRGSGAPIGGTYESEDIPLEEYDENGLPVIPLDSHARVARGDADGPTIFRRPYNYDAGFIDGELEFGLLFAMYANDLDSGFIPMQERIAQSDAFNEWNETIGSSVYFILPGASEGEILGEALFQ